MNSPHFKSAVVGPRRFQWQMGGWFGSVFGGAAWLIPTTVLLAVNGQSALALLPAVCFLLATLVGVVLWFRRDRVRPFPALIGMLVLFSCITPLVWFGIAFNATAESLAALNWSKHGIPAAIAAFICPTIIAWFCLLEYSHGGTSPASNSENSTVGEQ